MPLNQVTCCFVPFSCDFIEMPTKSAAGNAVALNLVTSDGLGYVT